MVGLKQKYMNALQQNSHIAPFDGLSRYEIIFNGLLSFYSQSIETNFAEIEEVLKKNGSPPRLIFTAD